MTSHQSLANLIEHCLIGLPGEPFGIAIVLPHLGRIDCYGHGRAVDISDNDAIGMRWFLAMEADEPRKGWQSSALNLSREQKSEMIEMLKSKEVNG